MTRIEEFIKKTQDNNNSISTLLREAKVLAHELNQSDFLSWINKELGGYKDDDSYPKYRNINGQVKGWNPYHGWIPVQHKNHELEKKLSNRNVNQSISEIEELLTSSNNKYEMPFPDSVASRIIEGPYKPKISLFIDRSSLVGLLNAIRNRLLDWAIDLNEQGIHGGSAELTPTEKEMVEKVDSKYHIDNMVNFTDSIGHNKNFDGKIIIPKESFLTKFFWYVVMAFIVLVAGNVISALILKYFFI